MTVRFSPVTKMTWMGMCFLDLTAWGQTETQALCLQARGQLPILSSVQLVHSHGFRGPGLLKSHPAQHRVSKGLANRCCL